ncbi:IS4 family transposase [Paraburkholderia sp. J63]|uniref:IS4 family transposase n=1 Tax=Paraburkholderia sp. J63 TaxID=2805434 RepID=UPI002ABD4F78|nr:IS4 family transposase [Paraburkholderia sp. J63]
MCLGRTCPDLDAGLLLEPDEWKAAFILKRTPPDKPPQLNEVVPLVVRLGGLLARKGDGEPGVKTVWPGKQRIVDFVEVNIASGIQTIPHYRGTPISALPNYI